VWREERLDSAERFRRDVENTLRRVGIGEGHHVLDCCCGSGTYATAAATLVGSTGLVYAIDQDDARLRELSREAESRGLRNISAIKQNIELGIPLPDGSVDFVLLYDIFWYFRPGEKKTENLLKEVRRVAKTNAVVSVYPTHADQSSLEHFKNRMQANGFDLLGECSNRLVHERSLVTGALLNYRKVYYNSRKA
jgi:ubiquinone/menaquinone biosynthesis C-methylase UbiE